MSRQAPGPEGPGNEAAELDRFSDAFMDYLFEHGHLSKSFRPWWQSRKRAIGTQTPAQAIRTVRSICKDHLEMTRHWPEPDVSAVDRYLEAKGTLTLTLLRRRLWHGTTTPTSPTAPRRPSPY